MKLTFFHFLTNLNLMWLMNLALKNFRKTIDILCMLHLTPSSFLDCEFLWSKNRVILLLCPTSFMVLIMLQILWVTVSVKISSVPNGRNPAQTGWSWKEYLLANVRKKSRQGWFCLQAQLDLRSLCLCLCLSLCIFISISLSPATVAFTSLLSSCWPHFLSLQKA